VNQVESNFAQAFKSPVAKPIVDILRRIRHMITPLSFHVQESRSMEFCGPEPDFLAAISGSQYDIHDGIPFKESISMENIVTFGRLCSLFNYPVLLRSVDEEDTLGRISKQLSYCFEDFPGFFLQESRYSRISSTVSRIPSTTEFTSRHALNTTFSPDGGSDNHLPVAFALLVRQHGSRPEGVWRRSRGYYDPPLFNQKQAIARAMQITPTHPAVILGVVVRGDYSLSPSDPSVVSGSLDAAIHHLSLQTEPSLATILSTWELRQKQRGESLEPPPWLVVFGLLMTPDNAVTIVAHFPYSAGMLEPVESGPDSVIRFCSCIVDTIPFHPEIRWRRGPRRSGRWDGPTTDDTWISDRLRLFLASLTLVTNSRLVSAIWDDIEWPQEMLDAEDALEKQHAH